jgi:hypothetical protein
MLLEDVVMVANVPTFLGMTVMTSVIATQWREKERERGLLSQNPTPTHPDPYSLSLGVLLRGNSSKDKASKASNRYKPC